MHAKHAAVIAFAALFSFAAPLAASADVYKSANFTVGVSGGNANQKSPFQGVVAPYPAGGTFTGQLVFDQDLVPAAGSGYVNVAFSSFPDIAAIPASSALQFQLGSLPAFTLDTALTEFGNQNAAIQYKNGNFNGLFYISNFNYSGSDYQLQIQGGALSIYAFTGGFVDYGNKVVNGYVNFSLSNVQSFTPGNNPGGPTGVPEPASLALLLAGLGGLGFAARRKSAGKA